jgi:hypothetical protein
LADLDFGLANGMADGIDWEALMNDGELWDSFGGGWNAGMQTGMTEDDGRGV